MDRFVSKNGHFNCAVLCVLDFVELIAAMSSTSGITPLKFVSAAEIEEKRKKRQEEWERVRQPHQPLGDLSCLTRLVMLRLSF